MRSALPIELDPCSVAAFACRLVGRGGSSATATLASTTRV